MYKIEELRRKSPEELLRLISELKGKLLALRFENATGNLNEPHLIKTTKKDIAKVFTVLNEYKTGKLSEEDLEERQNAGKKKNKKTSRRKS